MVTGERPDCHGVILSELTHLFTILDLPFKNMLAVFYQVQVGIGFISHGINKLIPQLFLKCYLPHSPNQCDSLARKVILNSGSSDKIC